MNKIINMKHTALKGRKRMTIVMALALMLVFAMNLSAFAGSVSYEGDAKGFVFTPGGAGSPTDLFDGLKDVMPGDSVTEEIGIKNRSREARNIYMRALAVNKEDADFLSQLQMKVTTADGNIVFDSAADKTAGLTEWTDIGSYAPGSSKKLSVKVTVPITMGNDYQDKAGNVRWQFMVEINDEPEDGDNPTPEDPDDPTPDKPETPDSPDRPSNPDDPTPDKPETPDSPDRPNNPDDPTPDKPETPDSPDRPNNPDNPTPDKPETPGAPARPTPSGNGDGNGGAKTGDYSNLFLWCGAGIAAVTTAVAVRRTRRRRS